MDTRELADAAVRAHNRRFTVLNPWRAQLVVLQDAEAGWPEAMIVAVRAALELADQQAGAGRQS